MVIAFAAPPSLPAHVDKSGTAHIQHREARIREAVRAGDLTQAEATELLRAQQLRREREIRKEKRERLDGAGNPMNKPALPPVTPAEPGREHP